MILTGSAIRSHFENGLIDIDPFDERQLNPASYDLRLGGEGLIYTREENEDLPHVSDRGILPLAITSNKQRLDSRVEQRATRFKIPPQGLVIHPGALYLLHTAERIRTDRFAVVIDGKSSIGRLGLVVHITAGYGDPGFDGQYTLEVASVSHQVVIYAGMRFCQARFQPLVGEVDRYQGNYTGEAALGPVRSASWKQF